MDEGNADVKASALRCEECGELAAGPARGWRAVLLAAEAEIAIYCPDCAEREFGEAC